VDHFFLYDDDPALPLSAFLAPHAEYVSVIKWFGKTFRENRQLAAFQHARERGASNFRWVGFIDVDEFILLRRHASLPEFLAEFDQYGSVRISYHLFGHNGYYNNPPGTITGALTRRMLAPAKRYKSITKVAAINDIPSSHYCILKRGHATVDPNKRRFNEEIYPGKTAVACVNHYMCRSFKNWMGRAARGTVVDTVLANYPGSKWKLTKKGCLRQFVESIAKVANEYEDHTMQVHQARIQAGVTAIGEKRRQLRAMGQVAEFPRPLPARRCK
jgi:hypothetical protein